MLLARSWRVQNHVQERSPIVRKYEEKERKTDFKHKTDCVKTI